VGPLDASNPNGPYRVIKILAGDWHKNKMTADIGDRLEFLAFEGGRLFQRRIEIVRDQHD
jgi:hypothetical protein